MSLDKKKDNVLQQLNLLPFTIKQSVIIVNLNRYIFLIVICKRNYATFTIICTFFLAVVIYTIYKELFSLDSPQGLYTMASDQCMNHPKVQDLLGE